MKKKLKYIVILTLLPAIFFISIIGMIAGPAASGNVSSEEEITQYLEIGADLGLAWDILILTGRGLGKQNPLEVALCFCKIAETEYTKKNQNWIMGNTYEYCGLEEILNYADLSSLETTDIQEFKEILNTAAERKTSEKKKYEANLIADTDYRKVLHKLGFSKADIDQIMEIHENGELAKAYGIDESQYYETETVYGVYSGTCIDGLIYDNPDAPIYKGEFAERANKYRGMVRKMARELDMECYLDIYMSMLANECSLDLSSNNPSQVNGFKGSSEMSVRAGLMHLKKDIENVQKCGITDIAALVQCYNFGSDYIFSFVSKTADKKDSMAAREKYRKKWPGYGDMKYADKVLSRVKGQRPGLAEGVTSNGQKIANYALKFVGNPYVWGGNSLTNGADCSGFVQAVYKHFDLDIPRTSRSQCAFSGGKTVASLNDAAPGDLLFYTDGRGVVEHVAMYIGNGQIVHASNSKPYPAGGIKISNAAYRNIYKIKRYLE